MQIYFGDIDDENTLEKALSLAPSWSNMFISRHLHGWVFVNAHGIYFVTDDNERGWVSTDPEQSERVYTHLGRQVSRIYYEE